MRHPMMLDGKLGTRVCTTPDRAVPCARRVQLLIFTLLALCLIPIAGAQSQDDNDMAPKMAEALTKAKVKTVVIFDFMGPGQRLNQLGRDFADEMSRGLTKSGGTYSVIDRSQVLAVIEKNRVAPGVIRDTALAGWLARQLHADALIVGKLSPAGGNRLEIAVASAKTKDGKEITTLSGVAAYRDEMDTRLKMTLGVFPNLDDLKAQPVEPPYPKCIRCPAAQYSAEAMSHTQQGTVILIIVVGEDGRAHDIDFARGLPYGLTQMAIEAVQSWTFEPSRDRDGKPRAVRQQIQVSFNLGL